MDREYTGRIIGCAIKVHKELGPGLLESIYEEALAKELRANGFMVERQVPVPVYYCGERLSTDMRLDLIIDRKVIIEVKSVVEYRSLFAKQLYTYLRLAHCELGYVINFNVELLRDNIQTVYNKYAAQSDALGLRG